MDKEAAEDRPEPATIVQGPDKNWIGDHVLEKNSKGYVLKDEHGVILWGISHSALKKHHDVGDPCLRFLGTKGGLPVFVDYSYSARLVPQDGALEWRTDFPFLISEINVNGKYLGEVVKGDEGDKLGFVRYSAGDVAQHPIIPECKYDSIKVDLRVVLQAGDDTEEIVLPVGEFVSTVDYY